MKPKKDIFDLFKANQHKLNESPSRQAWERLESRLDQHKDRNRVSIYRILSMAAAVIVLVAFVSVISFVFTPKAENAMAVETVSESFTTEELKVLTVSTESINQLAAYQRKYNNHPASPIQEGKANKKLIARLNVHRDEGLKTMIAAHQINNTQSFAASAPTTDSQKEIPQPSKALGTAAKNIEELNEESVDLAVSDSIHPDAAGNTAENVLTYELEDAADEDMAVAKEEYEAKDKASLSMRKTKIQAESSIQKLERSAAVSELSSPAPASGADNSTFSDIAQFQWLTGKWEGNINNQRSVEQWRLIDNQTIEGRGSLIINGKTTFNEDMKIQQIENVIYFVADLNGSGNPIYYKLVSNDGFQAVFENENIDFPNQVVLQRTNSSNFSTIYQNTQPGNINEAQQNYYLNRNYIQKEQVVRNLRRVND